MSTWLINYGAGDKTPAELGLTLLGGEWRSGGPSTVRMKASLKFDAAEICAYGTQVTLKRDGSPFFVGKVRPITKSAKGKREAHDYLIEDAWADLERLTYQEAWAINQADYTGPAYSSKVILGVNSAGIRISTSEQINEVLSFAIEMGVSIQVGYIPTGMMLWPSEVIGMSCAEVIRTSLRYHPDWIPWIDPTTSPPTVNIMPYLVADVRTRSVIGAADLQVTKMNDRVPEGVRIVYETAMMIDDEVYRTMAIDQAPVPEGDLADAAGPGILVTHVELQGMQMQIQKQQVVTRPLPTDSTTLKTYLKNKFPELAGVADAHWDCKFILKAMLPDVEETIDPIDGKLVRKYTTTPANVPRELVKGNIAEWMQRYVGRVLIEFEAFSTAAATDDEQKQIDKLPTKITVTATNAGTKTYKGISGYQAGEEVPTGIAAAYLATIQNGCNYAGSIRIKEDDVGATRWHGSNLNLTDGDSAWATMQAPIHSVVWDLMTKDVSIGFGPNPDYSIADYLEFLRLLNKRVYTDYTMAERTSAELGSDTSVSARGDTAGPLDVPETITGGGKNTPPPFWPTLKSVSGAYSFTLTDGHVIDFKGGKGNADALGIYYPTGIGTLGGARTDVTITPGQQISIVVNVDKDGDFYSASLTVEAEDATSTNPDPTTSGGAGAAGVYHFKIAVLRAASGDVPAYFQHYLAGSHILMRHRGHNLDQHVFAMDNSYGILTYGTDYYLCWRNGDYVGKFGSADTLPGHVGTLDTASVTFIASTYPDPFE